MGELVHISRIDPQTPISIPTNEGPIAMSVADVGRWIAPGAPPNECLKFLLTCKAAGVNPFLQEAYLVGYGSQWATIISKSGWLRKAEEHPAYNGYQAGIIVQRITKMQDAEGNLVLGPDKKPILEYHETQDLEGAFQPGGYKLVGGWARVYRKDRERPHVMRVDLTEYRDDRSPNWKNKPATMIRKVALVQSLREAGFLPKGMYDQDEMGGAEDNAAYSARIVSAPPESIPTHAREAIDAEYAATPTHQLDTGIAAELQALIMELGMAPEDVAAMCSRRGAGSIVELSDFEARNILGKLTAVLERERIGQSLLPDPAPTEIIDAEVIDAEVA